MKLSDHSVPPDSGIANLISGFDFAICATSPDHANAAARLPEPRSFTYSLPLTPSILPSDNACLIRVKDGSASASVGFLMSLPSASMNRPTVSRISLSTVLVPPTAKKSSMVLTSLPVVLML